MQFLAKVRRKNVKFDVFSFMKRDIKKRWRKKFCFLRVDIFVGFIQAGSACIARNKNLDFGVFCKYFTKYCRPFKNFCMSKWQIVFYVFSWVFVVKPQNFAELSTKNMRWSYNCVVDSNEKIALAAYNLPWTLRCT